MTGFHGMEATVLHGLNAQKQPSSGVLRKGYSKNIHQIYWRTPTPKWQLY